MELDSVLVYKHAKKEPGQFPAVLTEQAWSIKDLLYGFRGNFSCGTRPVVPSSILPASVANHIAGFDSSCPAARRASHLITVVTGWLGWLGSCSIGEKPFSVGLFDHLFPNRPQTRLKPGLKQWKKHLHDYVARL